MSDPLARFRVGGHAHMNATEVTEEWVEVDVAVRQFAKDCARTDYDLGILLLKVRETQTWARAGFASMNEYVDRVLGMKGRELAERLRAADALCNLPATSEALREGRICWSAAREITRAADATTEAGYLKRADGKRMREIEKFCAGKKPGMTAEEEGKEELMRHCLRMDDLSGDELVFARTALDKEKEMRGEPGMSDTRAFLGLLQRAAGVNDKLPAFQIALSVCSGCATGTGSVKGEPLQVSMNMLYAALYNGEVVGDLDTGTIPARRVRTISITTDRFVRSRAGHCCEAPGCRNSVNPLIHHVDPWAEGGDHDPKLLVLLCWRHHQLHHRGEIHILGNQIEGLRWEHADGRPYGSRERDAVASSVQAQAFRALRNLGWAETRVIAALAKIRKTHLDADLETTFAAALALLKIEGKPYDISPYGPRGAKVKSESENPEPPPPGYTHVGVPEPGPNEADAVGQLVKQGFPTETARVAVTGVAASDPNATCEQLVERARTFLGKGSIAGETGGYTHVGVLEWLQDPGVEYAAPRRQRNLATT